MPNRSRPNLRDKIARTSSAEVYYLDDDGNKVRVNAHAFTEANRPLKGRKHYCLSCDQEMVFHIGRKKPNQPETLDGSLVRSDPAFQHKAGTLDIHINTEADSIAYDLAKFIREYSKKKGWIVSEREGTSSSTWVMLVTADDTKGTVRSIPFVIAPNLTHVLSDNPDAVFITSTTGQAGDRKRLVLYDDKYCPLSAQQVKDAVVEMDPSKFFVSGYFRFNPRGMEKSKDIFLPRQIKLTQALTDIMMGKKVFVEGVDAIPNRKFETNARYALVDTEVSQKVMELISQSRPEMKRRKVAIGIAQELGLSIHYDKSTVGTTNRHKFGGGEVLYVFSDMENNPAGLFKDGDHKIVVNPSPALMLRNLHKEDWKNTMVLFVGDSHNAKQFYYRYKKFIDDNPDLNLIRRDIATSKLATKLVKEFLGEELTRRQQDTALTKERMRPDSYDINKNFLDYETGVNHIPEPPTRRLEYDQQEWWSKILD